MRYLTLLLLIGALGIAGCASEAGPDETPILRSVDEYNSSNQRATDLWQGAANDLAENGRLSPQSEADLREAARLFEGMIAYRPEIMATHSGLGQVYHMLGEYRRAIASLKQAVALPAAETKENVALVAQSLHLMSLSHMQLQQYEDALNAAKQALTLVPDHPDYMAAAAGALIQLKREDEAKALIAAALENDPENAAALRLKKLLELAVQP